MTALTWLIIFIVPICYGIGFLGCIVLSFACLREENRKEETNENIQGF